MIYNQNLRDVMSYQEIYLTLLAQFEIAKLEELIESPVINILDKAEPAVEKNGQNYYI